MRIPKNSALGIDRIIYLKRDKVVTVEEKVRMKVYPDFALERWSDLKKAEAWLDTEGFVL